MFVHDLKRVYANSTDIFVPYRLPIVFCLKTRKTWSWLDFTALLKRQLPDVWYLDSEY